MNRFTSALLGLGLLAGISAPAVAADVTADTYAAMGWYLRADAGWSWMNWDASTDDTGLVVGGGVGYQFNDNLRTDLRVDWSGTFENANGDNVDVGTILGNVYYDIQLDAPITPYVGAGVGYGWSQGDRDGAAFALMAGAEIGLTDNLSADLEYRYRHVLVSDLADPMEHQILVGLRYKF